MSPPISASLDWPESLCFLTNSSSIRLLPNYEHNLWKQMNVFWCKSAQVVREARTWNDQHRGQEVRGHKNACNAMSDELSDEFWANLAGTCYDKSPLCGSSSNWDAKQKCADTCLQAFWASADGHWCKICSAADADADTPHWSHDYAAMLWFSLIFFKIEVIAVICDAK